MLERSLVLWITTWLLLCPASAHTVEISDVDYHLGHMFWVIFIVAVIGFFVYLFCSYMPLEAPPPPVYHRVPPEENVVSVRILNLPELLRQCQQHGRAFSPQSDASA
jgi:hypothetical protein